MCESGFSTESLVGIVSKSLFEKIQAVRRNSEVKGAYSYLEEALRIVSRLGLKSCFIWNSGQFLSFLASG